MSSNNGNTNQPRRSSRKEDMARNDQLKKKKNDLEERRRDKHKRLKKMKSELEKTKKRLDEAEDGQTRTALESALKELLADCSKEEKLIDECNAQLDEMDIDKDQDQPEENQPEDNQPEDNQPGENQPGENQPGEDQPGENQPGENQPGENQPGENQHGRGSSSDGQSRHLNSSQASDGNVPNLAFTIEDTDNHQGLFTPEQTPESGVRGSQDCDKPQTFEDCVPEAPGPTQEEHLNFSLENGICMMTAQQGKLSMNRYGPRNSAVHVWSGTPAAFPVAKMTSLHGAPHKVATDTDLVTGALLWKFKIGAIRSVAWLPKKACDSMLTLLESVEDLNPSKKIDDPKYKYPFSSAVVDLIGGPSCVCVSRSDYKRLCKGGKESHARIDRKFYTVACSQVKKYREWAGTDLDASWSGAARVGRDDRSLTPFYNTPQPESLATSSQVATPPPASTPPASTPPASTPPASTPPASTPPASTPPASTPPASTPPASTPPASTPATSNSSSPPSQDREDTSEDVGEITTPISEFYVAFLTYKNVDPDTLWRSLDMETYTQFIAASKVYIAELKSKKMKVLDDMNFGRALGPQ